MKTSSRGWFSSMFDSESGPVSHPFKTVSRSSYPSFAPGKVPASQRNIPSTEQMVYNQAEMINNARGQQNVIHNQQQTLYYPMAPSGTTIYSIPPNINYQQPVSPATTLVQKSSSVASRYPSKPIPSTTQSIPNVMENMVEIENQPVHHSFPGIYQHQSMAPIIPNLINNTSILYNQSSNSSMMTTPTEAKYSLKMVCLT